MSDVYFKASLQNTLNPEVGTFDNVSNKESVFTLEDGEYYLTNPYSDQGGSYRVYYPTKNLYSVGFTVEFDINYNGSNVGFHWCLLFNSGSTNWYGFGMFGDVLRFVDPTLPNYNLTSPLNTWSHVKCIFDYYNSKNHVHIYVNNSEVTTFNISKDYGIKYIDILGDSNNATTSIKIKNIIIYGNKKHFLDTPGLTSLWSKIKSLFATKTELASKANTSDLSTVATTGSYNDLLDKPTFDSSNYYTKSEVYNLLSNYYTKTQIDIMLNSAGSDKYGMSITADESEGGNDTQGGLSFWNAVERAPGYDGTSQMNIAEDSNTVEDE